MTPAPDPDATDYERPWIGLRSFDRTTRQLFYGRKPEIGELVQRVRRNPVTILYGSSGFGKTSLIGAGLIPELESLGYLPVEIKLQFLQADPAQARQDLAQQVKAQIASAIAATGALGLAEELKNKGELWDILHDRRRGFLAAAAPKLVLVFDQFEEVFTLGNRTPEERDLFLKQLSNVIENRPSPVMARRLEGNAGLADHFDFLERPAKVLLALREDYLSKLERWRPVMPSIMSNRMELRPLTGRQAYLAVYKPGSLGGHEIVAPLVAEKIVRSVAGAAEDRDMSEIEAVPPLLSLYSERLNQRRLDHGQKSILASEVEGKLDEILDEFFNECFAELHPVIRLFVEYKLVSSGSPAVREAPALDTVVGELAPLMGPQPAREQIEMLRSRRLITQEEFEGAVRIRLVHDILVPVAVRSRQAARATLRQQEAAESKVRSRPIPDAAGIMTFRLFLSTGGDAAGEREVVLRLCQRLGEAYGGRVRPEIYTWEDFSGKVPSGEDLKDFVAALDAVILIVRHRLGPPLADKTFAAGFLDELFQIAREQHTRHGRPYLEVYRNSMPFLELVDNTKTSEDYEELRRVHNFFKLHFEGDRRAEGNYHNYQTLPELETQLGGHLSSFLEREFGTIRKSSSERHDNPYPGSRHFTPQEDVFFSGRDQELRHFDSLLEFNARPEVRILVSGPSGCGKTSFLLAGVVPLLRRKSSEGGVDWHPVRVVFQPGRRLLPTLGDACMAAPGLAERGLDVSGIWHHHGFPGDMVVQIDQAIASVGYGTKAPLGLVIILDQLEDLLADKQREPGELRDFFLILSLLARDRCLVVGAVGDHCETAMLANQSFQNLFGSKDTAAVLRLDPLSGERLRGVIVNPARYAGASFEQQGSLSLVDRILREFEGSEGASSHLQRILAHLWERSTINHELNFASYEGVGGDGLFRKVMGEAHSKLSSQAEEEFQRMMIRFTSYHFRPTGPRRRWVPLSQLPDSAGAQEWLAVFTGHRIVMLAQHEGIPQAILTHDAFLRIWQEHPREYLITPLQERALAQAEGMVGRWLATHADNDLLLLEPDTLATLVQLDSRDYLNPELSVMLAHAVKARNEEDQKSAKRKKRVLLALVVAVLAGAGMGGIAFARFVPKPEQLANPALIREMQELRDKATREGRTDDATKVQKLIDSLGREASEHTNSGVLRGP